MMKKSVILSTVVLGCALLAGFFYYMKYASDRNLIQKPSISSENKDVPIQSTKNTEVKEKQVFKESDAKILNIDIGMKKEEVERILGAPSEIKKEYVEAFGAEQLQYRYPFGVVKLDPIDIDVYSVSSIEIDKSNYLGPRNTSVGDNLESVIEKFPNGDESKINEFKEKCLYGKHEDGNRGFILYDDKGRTESITYYFGGEGGGYALVYKIQNNKVLSIFIGVQTI